MKIIFVTRESSEMPAVRIRCYNFAKYLRMAGISTKVFSYADELGAKSGKEERKMSILDKCLYNINAYKKLAKEKAIIVLQRFNYHSFAPLFLKATKNCKLVFDLDDWEAREDTRYYFNRIPNSKAEIMMRLIARQSHLCIGSSKFLVDFLKNYNKNVIYLPTAVDTDFFNAECPNKNDDNLILSWLGTMHRLDNMENIEFLIGCFKELSRQYKNITLEITGDGIFFEKVKRLITEQNNSRILLKPWIAAEAVPQYLAKIDIAVMPLIQKTKFNIGKSPTKLFEYMAMEKPVVASAIGEADQIINDGYNGFLAKTKVEFVKKIKRLIEDKTLRYTLGKNARKTILKNYSIDLIAKVFVDEIKKI